MTALAPVAPKLAQLMPVLDTAEGDECLAAVRAIRSALEAAGLDWGAVAAELAKGPPAASCAPSVCPSEPPPSTWFEMARWCLRHGASVMSPRDVQFIGTLCGYIDNDRRPSGRQMRWLWNIVHRIRQRHGDYGSADRD